MTKPAKNGPQQKAGARQRGKGGRRQPQRMSGPPKKARKAPVPKAKERASPATSEKARITPAEAPASLGAASQVDGDRASTEGAASVAPKGTITVPFKFCWDPIQPRLRIDGSAAKPPGCAAQPGSWVVPGRLTQPAGRSKPTSVLVGSEYDLFCPEVPDPYIGLIAKVMEMVSWHAYYVEVTNVGRMKELLAGPLRSAAELPHVYWGVRVRNSEELPRVEILRSSQARNSFVIFGPLDRSLTIPHDTDLSGIRWVVADGAGESLPRSLRYDCIRGIPQLCERAKIPLFFTGWDTSSDDEADRTIDGETHSEHPAQPTEAYPDWEDCVDDLEDLVEQIDGLRTWAIEKDAVIDCDECGQPALFKRLEGLVGNPNGYDCGDCDQTGCWRCCAVNYSCAEHDKWGDCWIPVADSFAGYWHDEDFDYRKHEHRSLDD